MHGVVVAFQHPAGGIVSLVGSTVPVSNRSVVGIEIGGRQMEGAQPQKKMEGGIDYTSVADHHDGFALILLDKPVERGAGAQHKLYPTFGTGDDLEKRLLLVWNRFEVLDIFIDIERLILGKTPFLQIIIIENRQTQGRSNNLGSLPGSQHRAGNQDIGPDLASICQTVTQSLGLSYPQRSQARVLQRVSARCCGVSMTNKVQVGHGVSFS